MIGLWVFVTGGRPYLFVIAGHPAECTARPRLRLERRNVMLKVILPTAGSFTLMMALWAVVGTMSQVGGI